MSLQETYNLPRNYHGNAVSLAINPPSVPEWRSVRHSTLTLTVTRPNVGPSMDGASVLGQITQVWAPRPVIAELSLLTDIQSWYLALGFVLITASIVDLLWTSLWVDGGAGPISSRTTTLIWRGLRRAGRDRPRILSLAGPLTLVATLVLWVGLLWAGWTFVFAGGEGALIDTRDTGPIAWTERTYFVAYSMFTMGNGDFTPADGVWQIATSLTTASGMLFVTLGVSYVISVLGAVTDKRSFAGSVIGLGSRSEAFVCNGWVDGDFRGLDLPINMLASDLDRLAEQHKAYPILHYYHSQRGARSAAMAIAIFDETMTILRKGIPEEDRPNQALIENGCSSADSYLQTLNQAFISPAEKTPPPPDLDLLRKDDIPTVSDEEFAEAIEDLSHRRRQLLGAVQADAWHWPPVDRK